MNGSGSYDLLGKIMLRAHGSLKEVKLLEKAKGFVLVFGDGTELEPGRESKRKEWYLGHRELLMEYLSAGYGGDPLHVLAFGYSGTGSQNLATLLRSCGFKDTTIITSEEDAVGFPVVLRPDGRLVTATGELIDVELERQKRAAAERQRRADEERRRAEEAKRRAEEERRREEAEAERQAEELRKSQVIQERRNRNQCIMCGQAIGILEKLFRRDKHGSCKWLHE